MSVKKDASGRRSVEVEVEVLGTPEEVWQAIATGPGISSWFLPTEVEADEDGNPVRIVCQFGPGMESAAEVTAWEPPHRFVGENSWVPGMPTVATEWIVEARSGGTCIVRVVHSLFASTDDWDDQLEGTETGWPVFFGVLRLYLAHFAGQPCSTFRAQGVASGSISEAWGSFTGSLGLGNASAGERRSASSDAPLLTGLVESTGGGEHPHALLRVDEPAAGIASLSAYTMGGMVHLAASLFFYGEQAAGAVDQHEQAWNGWMGKLFPTPVDASGGC